MDKGFWKSASDKGSKEDKLGVNGVISSSLVR